MVTSLLKKIFGSRNDRLLKQYGSHVKQINALESTMKAMDDATLKEQTQKLRDRLAGGATLDQILPEAFATVREASVRVFGMRHFDVQLVGGIALHNGKIAEMRTGEGKTLTATSAVYLNALEGKGVHVVTVNDYLAQRDANWMGKLYSFLGMSVGVIISQQPTEDKIHAYACDITYGTNNEYGFDYLRDNMEYRIEDRRQRKLHYAIVDEVDSILIDEARTPLIISGQAEDHTEVYQRMNAVPPLLDRMQAEPKPQEPEPAGDFWVDEKQHQIHLSEAGHVKAEEVLTRLGLLPEGQSLYDPRNILLMHHLMASLRAHHLFHKDQHYVVQPDEEGQMSVTIVDEFTGRLMVGRRWSEGLHQAVEAKEGVPIQNENQTLASITFQNYFRMYNKLAGMTGTADTEAFEFQSIYNLETVLIPTHRNMVRIDQNDQVFRTEKEKYGAVLEDIKACYKRGQPVLVGTGSIEQSELVATILKAEKLPHEVLNAKQHAREADIIAQAGKPKAITISTNMAGRGTDIVLGGNIEKQIELIRATENMFEQEKETRINKLREEWKALHQQVLDAGGLRVIGTERHESRRIDNQLRGRSGRQGDPGSSRFYLSMEDSLLRVFAGDRMKKVMEFVKLPEGEPIEAGMVTRSIESAQRKVEGRNFDIRKQLLEYDDVANDQRKELYALRNEVLESSDISEMMGNLRAGVFTNLLRNHIPENSVEDQWDVATLETTLNNDFQLSVPLTQMLKDESNLTDDDLLERVIKAADTAYNTKIETVGKDNWGGFERSILLQTLDQYWREHLAALDQLRQGIHLRGYAQKNPKQEYKRESFELFESLLNRVRDETTRLLMTVRIQDPEQIEEAEEAMAQSAVQNLRYQHADYDEALASANAEDNTSGQTIRQGLKVGRNDPCPCGSGKKFKQCHGKLS